MTFIKVDTGYQLSPKYRISSNENELYKRKNDSLSIIKRDNKLYHDLLLEYTEYWWD